MAACDYFALLLLLLTLLLATDVAADLPRTTHIQVSDGEFVTLHVGYPGEDVAFRIRWNLANVALLRPVRSRTYDAIHGTDLVCFGVSCLRMRIDYANADPPSVNSPQLELRGYTGLLGLAPGSPVYAYFPWVRYTEHMLELCAHAPRPPRDAIFPSAGGVFGALLDKVPASMHVAMAIDNSLVPWTYSDREWKLELFQHSSATDKRKRVVRVTMDSQREEVLSVDSSRVTIIRPLAGNVTDLVLLGRLVTQHLFTVATDASGSVLWLEPDCSHHTRVSLLDYAPLLLALLFVHGLWSLGIAEDVNVAEGVAHIDIAEPSSHDAMLQIHQRLYTVQSSVFKKPSLPPDIGNAWQPQALISFRNAEFVRALAWLTTMVCVVTALFATFGARLGSGITPSFNAAQDAVAVYSTCGVLLLMCAGAHAATTQPNTAVAYGSSAPLLAIWLVALVCSRDIVIVIALLVTSAIVCIHLLRLALSSALGTLWPTEAYGGLYIHSQAHRVHSRALYLFWLALNGTLAVWASWLGAFYTLPLVLRDWRPAHPLSYGVGALGFLVCAICAMSTYYSRQLLYAKLSSACVSRTGLYTALFREHVRQLENQQQ
jgi:hypothetical protein